MFPLQVVPSPAAGISLYRRQDTPWSCSSDAIELSPSSCLMDSRSCSWDHSRWNTQGGDFWEERELDLGHFLDWVWKNIGWTVAVLVKASRQEDRQKPYQWEWCVAPRSDWTPRTWPTGRNIASGHRVRLDTGKCQVSSIGAHWGKWRRVCVSIAQGCYRSTLRVNLRKENLSCP